MIRPITPKLKSRSSRHFLPSCFLLLLSSSLQKTTSLSTTTLPSQSQRTTTLRMSTSSTDTAPTWPSLQSLSLKTPVGSALQSDAKSRTSGQGSPNVHNKLRQFSSAEKPKITLFRDHAGWCPYCEKTILLVEEKKIPINIELVPMRSYGDKPTDFMRLVPSGLLPALMVEDAKGGRQVITESQVIMELLDEWHPPSDGYVSMMPEDSNGKRRHNELARLERELFSWWCTFLFRPEGGGGRGIGGAIMGAITGNNSDEMSGSMRGFLDCVSKVDAELLKTPGPWFFDSPHPLMIDLVFLSHIERMLASAAYWKGVRIRGSGNFRGIDAWFDAFDQRESYLAFKSDFYTNVMDIPPQYGPGYFGGYQDLQEKMEGIISGNDGKSWSLPLSHDDPLQPLYKGPPLPVCALEAVGLHDNYAKAPPPIMARACRQAAGWKLASNGSNVSRFAARGGSEGAKNRRKTFGAPLADPYADPDESIRPMVDSVMQVVCNTLLLEEDGDGRIHEQVLKEDWEIKVKSVDMDGKAEDVASSLRYLRDRIGVPRDMPLAAARQFRAHLNWAIDVIKS